MRKSRFTDEQMVTILPKPVGCRSLRAHKFPIDYVRFHASRRRRFDLRPLRVRHLSRSRDHDHWVRHVHTPSTILTTGSPTFQPA
jgi:hypothetical protein